ncbi:hypothetical protein [Marinifilum sp.]|uniref:hypothetical protein n=1 Tax=Marinifilum sp. TaxID=2033137 RepID=UPI003BAADC0E
MIHEVVNDFNIESLIIIEDSIACIEQVEEALTKFCLSNSETTNKIIGNLLLFELGNIAEGLIELKYLTDKYCDDETSRELLLNMELCRFFEKNGLPEYEQVLKYVSLLEKEYSKYKNVFKKHGVAGFGGEYEKIVGDILYKKELGLTIFDSTGNFKEICEILKRESRGWSLAIIDKKLKGGDDGKAFAIDLYKFCSENNIHFSSVILTSNFEETVKIEAKDYFITEIEKGSNDIEAELVSTLAQSAYVSMFNGVKNKSREAIDEAFKLVLGNSNNIAKIIYQSKNEGISSFDAILDSFNLAHTFKLSNKINQTFKHDFLMANSINTNAFQNHMGLEDISEDLKQLNCFEIFDYSINKKYSPIGNGDVFKIEDEYYVLMAQSCDVSLRASNNKRKLKNADLVRIKFREGILENKYVIDVNESESVVRLNYFKSEGIFGSISVKFNDIKTCDYVVLDLCSYNNDGKSSIEINTDLGGEVANVLASNRIEYYNDINRMLNEVKDIEIPQIITQHLNDFNIWNGSIDGRTFNWSANRVCRIKGEFLSSLYNEYSKFKSRVGLNNLFPAAEIAVLKKIYVSYPSNHLERAYDINLWESKGNRFIKLDELTSKIYGDFNVLGFLDLPEEIKIEESKKYKLIQSDDKLRLELAYYNHVKNLPHRKSRITCSDLKLKSQELKTEEGETILPNRINIANINGGIIVEEENKIIKLDGGILQVGECQDQTK